MTLLHEETLQQIDQLKDIEPSDESTWRAISRAKSALLDQPEDDQGVQPNRQPRRNEIKRFQKRHSTAKSAD